MVFAISFLLFAGNPQIRTIHFSGNFSIDREIVLRLLSLEVGQDYSINRKKHDENILNKSSLFQHAAIKIKIVNPEQCDITIELKEKRSWAASPYFYKIKGNQKYAFSFQERNLFNRYVLLSLYSEYLNSQFSLNISSEIPRFWGKNDLLLALYRHREAIPLEDQGKEIDYMIKRSGFWIGNRHHFSDFFYGEGRIEYFEESYERAQESLRLPKNYRTNKLHLATTVEYSKLQKKFYWENGFQIQAKLDYYNDLMNNYHFQILTSSFRYFKSQKKQTLATRFLLGTSSQSNELYPFVTDGFSTIRIARYQEDRGQDMLLLNSEYRYVFFETKDFYLQSVAFFDYISLRTRDTNDIVRKTASQSRSFGLGFRFELKSWYNALLRVDFPIENDKIGLNIGIGQFF